MKILFCTEGFIIDGVAAYNLYLSAALRRCGHEVAVLGRWMGTKGFQRRHRKAGVAVVQCPPASVSNPYLVHRARRFAPDVVITDSRRAFPLARKVRAATGARVFTVFQDPPQPERRGIRSIAALAQGSDAWITSEARIYDELLTLDVDVPRHCFQRPFTGILTPTPLPTPDPFRVLCLGRLSRWKTPGFRALAERADELRRHIPSLELAFLGGGRRKVAFQRLAAAANRKAGRRFVRVLGARSDPQPLLEWATVVCAGAGAAIEALLANRPVVAFSGFWFGPVTEENLERGIATYFSEREGAFYVRDDPEVVGRALIDLYRQWNPDDMTARTARICREVTAHFDSDDLAGKYTELFEKSEQQKTRGQMTNDE